MLPFLFSFSATTMPFLFSFLFIYGGQRKKNQGYDGRRRTKGGIEKLYCRICREVVAAKLSSYRQRSEFLGTSRWDD
ncbi:unnamed protein product [Linum trigynum]|uniref:Secreted protein n=1 Tax=Linum trigynum TaxID=586398 RepID=A0AAV2DLZ3_9ROSI